LYSGEQFDTDAQQYYLRARYYNQNNGTFNRVDPYAGNTQDPQSLHKYAYCHNNPVNAIDPTGMFSLSEVQVTIKTHVSMLSKISRVMNRVVKWKNRLGIAVDIITGLKGLTVVNWSEYFFNYLGSVSNQVGFKPLFESKFWEQSAMSFSAYSWKIATRLMRVSYAKQILGMLNSDCEQGFPKLVIQMPLPNLPFNLPRSPLIPTGLNIKIGKVKIPVAIQFGGKLGKKGWSGRVLGFAVANGRGTNNILQFLRQDWGHWHGGGSMDRWLDKSTSYNIHYHIMQK
jgi:RHS repeat-associated protein